MHLVKYLDSSSFKSVKQQCQDVYLSNCYNNLKQCQFLNYFTLNKR